jgi:SAM-dependent methyltransferase
MGDVNQLTYLKRVLPSVNGPVIEIGSKDYGSTSSFRDFYGGREYVGVDMEAGKNVDAIVDLTLGVGTLQQGHFALAICCSVLEHVRRPWVFAEHLSSLLAPGGTLFMSVPWVWRYHAYPDDYFRFSWRGVMELFPGFDWGHLCYSTNVPNEFVDITPENTGVDNAMAAHAQTPNGPRKYLPYLMVNMLGRKHA